MQPPVWKFSVQAPTFLTLAEKSVMIFSMLLVSAKSLQMKASSAQMTRMDKPGPGGRGRVKDGGSGQTRGFRIPWGGGLRRGHIGRLAWEGVSGDDLLGQAQLPPQRSHLIFVKIFQRLDDFSLQKDRRWIISDGSSQRSQHNIRDSDVIRDAQRLRSFCSRWS